MRPRLPLALVAAGFVLVGPTATPARPVHAASPRRILCSGGYVDGIVGGEHKCLRAGEFCSARHESDYRRYGFTCVNGHLRRGSGASSPAPAAPPAVLPGRTALLLPRIRASGCRVRGPLPDRRCSPGAVYANATLAMICTPGYSSAVRNVPESEKATVYAEYGIPRTHFGLSLIHI